MSTSLHPSNSGSSTTLEVASLSDTGLVRSNNEDRCAIAEPPPEVAPTQGVLLLVADGLGGHNAGEKASEMVVSLLPALFYRETSRDPISDLRSCIAQVNREMFQKAGENSETRGMGSTVAAAVVTANTLVSANVGDSRIYLLRNGSFDRLSTDHIVYKNLFSFMDGTRAKEPRSVLTQALGPRPEVVPSIRRHSLSAGDVLLLCSDGLTGLVRDREIKSVLETMPPHVAAESLVDLAKRAGGHDNITVVVARVTQVASDPSAPVRLLNRNHEKISFC